MSIASYIGKANDSHTKQSIFGKLNTLLGHAEYRGRVHPSLAAGITVAGGVGAWALSAAWIEIIPATTIPNHFDIHWVTLESATVNDEYELVFAQGAGGSEVEIGRIRFVQGAVFSALSDIPVNLLECDADARISVKLASATGGSTVVISVRYHEH